MEDFYNNFCFGFLNPEVVKEQRKTANWISYSNKKTGTSYEKICFFVCPCSVKGKLLCGSRSSDSLSSHFPDTGLTVSAVIPRGMKLKIQAP